MTKATVKFTYTKNGRNQKALIKPRLLKIATCSSNQRKFFQKYKCVTSKIQRKYKKKIETTIGQNPNARVFICKRTKLEHDEVHGIILNDSVRSNSSLLRVNGHKKTFVFTKDRLEVVCLHNILSEKAKKGQSYFFELHKLSPLIIKPQCKFGGYPEEDKIRRGLNDVGARKHHGTLDSDFYDIGVTGRGTKGNYRNKAGKTKNKNGDLLLRSIDNPVSRSEYGDASKMGTSTKNAIRAFELEWEKKKDLLGTSYKEIEDAVEAFYSEMKCISQEYLPLFVGVKGDPSHFNETYWDENLRITTNLLNLQNQSAGHFDTKPEQDGFFTMLSMQCDKILEDEGELAFPEMGIRILYNIGDIILMRPDLYHGVLSMKSNSDRFSMAIYNNFSTFNKE